MFLDIHSTWTPKTVYEVLNWAVVYPTRDLASKYPHGFLEGSIESYASSLSKRFSVHVEPVRTGEKLVILENLDGIYVKVITETGFVGWVLTKDPRSEEEMAAANLLEW